MLTDQPKNKPPKRSSETPSTLLRFMDMGFRMGATIAVGTFAGRWLDGRLAMTKPIFTLILCLLAVGISIYMVYRDVSQPKQ